MQRSRGITVCIEQGQRQRATQDRGESGIAGSATGKKAKAILLMDGTRNQAGIVKECGIDGGDLSVVVKKLKGAELLRGDPKQPLLAISIPSDFFKQGGESE